MSLFSEQIYFCVNCGRQIERIIKWPWYPTCGESCFKEKEWKDTLSIMGKIYHPQGEFYE